MTEIIGQPKGNEWFDNFKDYLKPDSLFKIGAIITAITYALGYLIVTLHLSKYGVTTFEILRLQYIMAGFWFISPFIGVISLPLIPYATYKLISDPNNRNNNFEKSFSIIIIIVPLLGMILLSFIFMRELDAPTIYYLVLSPSYIMLITISLLWRIPKIFSSSSLRKSFKYLLRALSIISISVVFFHFFVFTLRVYPYIPRSYGGGKPISVKIIHNSTYELSEFPYNQKINSNNAQFCKLLFETSDQVILLPYDSANTAISISKDQIAAIVYNP